jgi:two-component system CheB/CheR fusion protein
MLFFDLGNRQWNIPKLRALLHDIIPQNSELYNFEIRHTFLHIGEKIILLNAKRVVQNTHREQLILLNIADVTEVRRLLLEKEVRENEWHKKEIEQQKTQSILLEETVKQRTGDLIQANQDLEKMNKELEAFTYVSNHDLQEPLRKIQIFSGRILEKEYGNLTVDGKKYFGLLQNSAQRMQTLIRDILAFSSIKAAGRKFESTDLQIIIDEVREELKEAIAEKHAIIEVKEHCEVRIIRHQFRQLINILIGNALKFSRPKIKLRVAIKSVIVRYSRLNMADLPPQKEYCHISVSDNGMGFEQEFSEKIFEVFYRLHPKDEYEGSGIGLAIVKKIVDNHKGVISATSQLNKGTTFNIYIPV